MNDNTKNVTGHIFAGIGAVISVIVQIVYFFYFGLVDWLDAIVPGITTGVLVLLGYKLGKGVYDKSFPVFLTVVSVAAVFLGFSAGIALLIYDMGDFTLLESFLIFFDEYLAIEFQGITLYYSQGIQDFGFAIGIAVLIVCAKYFYNKKA
jgi:hypothetical protein